MNQQYPKAATYTPKNPNDSHLTSITDHKALCFSIGSYSEQRIKALRTHDTAEICLSQIQRNIDDDVITLDEFFALIKDMATDAEREGGVLGLPIKVEWMIREQQRYFERFEQKIQEEKTIIKEFFGRLLLQIEAQFHSYQKSMFEALEFEKTFFKVNQSVLLAGFEDLKPKLVQPLDMQKIKAVDSLIEEIKATKEFAVIEKNINKLYKSFFEIKEESKTQKGNASPTQDEIEKSLQAQTLKWHKNMLESGANYIKNKILSPPSFRANTEILRNELANNSISALGQVVQPQARIFNQQDEIQIHLTEFDCKILNKDQNLRIIDPMLKAFLQNDYNFPKLTLLYRGTRDGMLCKEFQKRCCDRAATLMLCKSQKGDIFGGYSNFPWVNDGIYQASNNNFLFSYTAGEKYMVKKSFKDLAQRLPKNSGPQFGSGDLVLPDHFSKSYTKFEIGQAYSNIAIDRNGAFYLKKKLQGFKGGEFKLEEIEVFEVTENHKIKHAPLIQPSFEIVSYGAADLNSSIINEQQFNLLTSWLKRGLSDKNKRIMLFKLLYRGSQDGFSSERFHELCDHKGSTVTLVKATGGSVIGAYVRSSWSSSNTIIRTPEVMLFNMDTKSTLILEKNGSQIEGNTNFGPVVVSDRFKINGDCTEPLSNTCIFDVSGAQFYKKVGNESFYKFTAEDIEVYYVASSKV